MGGEEVVVRGSMQGSGKTSDKEECLAIREVKNGDVSMKVTSTETTSFSIWRVTSISFLKPGIPKEDTFDRFSCKFIFPRS